MTGAAADKLQTTIDFLSKLECEEVDWSSLSGPADYGAIVQMARKKGVETDGPALREAFALIMQARLLASRGLGGSDGT